MIKIKNGGYTASERNKRRREEKIREENNINGHEGKVCHINGWTDQIRII